MNWFAARRLRASFGAVLLLAGLGMAVATDARAQSASPPTVAEVRELLGLMDATAQIKKVIPALHKNIWAQIFKRNNSIPKGVQDEISKEMVALMANMAPLLIEITIPIYQRHFTGEEVRAASTFYRSPAGQAFARKSGDMMIESMQAGVMLGRQIGRKAAELAVKRLREKGYQL